VQEFFFEKVLSSKFNFLLAALLLLAAAAAAAPAPAAAPAYNGIIQYIY